MRADARASTSPSYAPGTNELCEQSKTERREFDPPCNPGCRSNRDKRASNERSVVIPALAAAAR